ncbi:helix-turn-helix domain-containing protein [Croceicoccus naphthovorans]|uniref:XRE family transcriptional regulator n=1 Tax=Croceicoccus naphthovorans TaxID=1348774 RepID=A0A0G3XJU6_9SPHN|nr:helix-turn-helix transcriptional regulator [Croceicoccus naphthovorans]AKM10638.1 XRE family transcriptional regulator [Croceicoccus naphthovorans]MBB3988868.1 transcriptional regulator with XRE-family HTH domain [Croceicoccus naphthovorans]
MINRIRAIRKDKGLTLADLAAACSPPTTAQTIGRLETGMRTLSIDWLNRIAIALGVEPEDLLTSEAKAKPMVVAKLGPDGPEALSKPREAVPPDVLLGEPVLGVLEIETAQGEYRNGDRIWLREIAADQTQLAINRDVLVPRPGGRFAFGRLIDRSDEFVAILPTGAGQRQLVVRDPAWVATAVMLVRML